MMLFKSISSKAFLILSNRGSPMSKKLSCIGCATFCSFDFIADLLSTFVGDWGLVIGDWLLVTGNWLLVIGAVVSSVAF